MSGPCVEVCWQVAMAAKRLGRPATRTELIDASGWSEDAVDRALRWLVERQAMHRNPAVILGRIGRGKGYVYALSDGWAAIIPFG